MISDERLREEARILMSQKRTLINVIVFTLAMVLVAAGLVVVFGQFRFAASNQFQATFTEASRLKSGQDVRISGVPVKITSPTSSDSPADSSAMIRSTVKCMSPSIADWTTSPFT